MNRLEKVIEAHEAINEFDKYNFKYFPEFSITVHGSSFSPVHVSVHGIPGELDIKLKLIDGLLVPFGQRLNSRQELIVDQVNESMKQEI